MTTITKKLKDEAKALMSEGADKNKLEGFLLFNGVDKKEAIGYLKELGLIGRITFRQWLTGASLEGYVSYESLVSRLEADGTENEKRHLKTFDNERRAYNNIHARYNAEIKALVDKEESK